jgi:AcrR family transcriptional regulator
VVKSKKNMAAENERQLFATDADFASTQNAELIEKRNQQIVEGALSLFLTKGYHPTTIREIAAACNMSMGQLYHYITSKDDVLYLVHKHMQKVWYKYLKKSRMNEIDDPVDKLSEVLHHTMMFMIENKKLIQFVYSESKYLGEKHLKVVLKLDQKNVVDFWRNLLREVNKTKKIRGDTDFTGSIIAFLLSFLALRGWTMKDYPKEEQIDLLVDFILRGLGVVSLG